MVHRDYRKEVGVVSPKKTVPKFVAAIVLAAVAVLLSFGVSQVLTAAEKHHKKPATTQATQAD